MSKMKFGGYVDYPEIGRINDEEVLKLIKSHSRFIDRMSTAKMVEMALFGQNILMGIFPNIKPDDPTWRFYGKKNRNSLENREWG